MHPIVFDCWHQGCATQSTDDLLGGILKEVATYSPLVECPGLHVDTIMLQDLQAERWLGARALYVQGEESVKTVETRSGMA